MSHFLELRGIHVVVIAVAHNHEFVAIEPCPLERFYKPVKAFLGDDAAHSHHIFTFFQPQRVDIVGLSGFDRSVHSIVNYRHIVETVVTSFQYINDYMANGDDVVRVLCLKALAFAQGSFCHASPLLPVIIRPMVSRHNFQPHEFCQWSAQCWPYGMNVHDVGLELAGFNQCQRGVDKGLGALAPGSIDVDNLNPFILADAVVVGHIAAATNQCHVASHSRQAGI